MLKLIIPTTEFFNTENDTFVPIKGGILAMEHSLVSISKWESKWKVHFLGNREITPEQFLDYVQCMTITQNPSPKWFEAIASSETLLKKISDYITDPMTATTINERNVQRVSGPYHADKIMTSELIYAWMAILKIPFSCEKWHINRLLTLIRVTSIEKQPPKKMSAREAMAQQDALNAMRRAKHRSRG